jgi:hypothetical protein
MKKVLLIVLAVVLSVSVCGCGKEEIDPKTVEKVFDITEYNMSITANETFYDNESENYNLQITDDKANISIMAYKTSEFETMTPKEVYEYHNQDMFSRREEVTVIKEEDTGVYVGRKIIHTRYSAVLDGSENYYDTFLIDFEGKGVFAWVLVNGLPETIEADGDYYHRIVRTIKLVEATDK